MAAATSAVRAARRNTLPPAKSPVAVMPNRSAVARVTGAYEFVTRAGRAEHQPAQFDATFVRIGERWRLSAVR